MSYKTDLYNAIRNKLAGVSFGTIVYNQDSSVSPGATSSPRKVYMNEESATFRQSKDPTQYIDTIDVWTVIFNLEFQKGTIDSTSLEEAFTSGLVLTGNDKPFLVKLNTIKYLHPPTSNATEGSLLEVEFKIKPLIY